MLRPYQEEAVESVKTFLEQKPGNPCVVLPTGAGKTHVIAALIEWTIRKGGRVLVLSHVKELLEQTFHKTQAHCPGVDIGLYSAGLNRRDTDNQVIVAGIQSVAKKACNLGAFDIILVDEAHLIPVDGEGRYREFFKVTALINPKARVVGLTATPFRTSTGWICKPENILTEVCYEARVHDLIADGYLCPLKNLSSRHAVNTSGLHVRKGEFIESEVEELFLAEDLVPKIVSEIIDRTKDRNAVLIFAATVKHGQLLQEEFLEYGIEAEAVFGETPSDERSRILGDFRAGHLKYLINRDVLTTGFDATHIDTVCLLRCTMSPGLYAQMVGRGFRIDERKQDCLVLDYGQNIQRHGPVNAVTPSEREYQGSDGKKKNTLRSLEENTCPNCGLEVDADALKCPECETVLRKAAMHAAEVSDESILAEDVQDNKYRIVEVRYRYHRKKTDPKAPPTLHVSYVPSFGTPISEWVCIEHPGYPGAKAFKWWKARSYVDFPSSVGSAVNLAKRGALAVPKTITVRTVSNSRFPTIINYELGPIPSEGSIEPIRAEDLVAETRPAPSRAISTEDYAF